MKVCFLKLKLNRGLFCALREPRRLDAGRGWLITSLLNEELPEQLTEQNGFQLQIADLDEEGDISTWRSPEWESVYAIAAFEGMVK